VDDESEGTRWRHGFNTQVHLAGFTLLNVLQAKHGSNKTALAKEQVRAYEAKCVLPASF